MGVCLFVWLSGQRPVSRNKRAPVVYYGITCGVTSLSHRPHPRSYQNSLRGDCWGKLFLFPNSVFFLFVLFPKWLKDLGPKTTWTQSTWFLTVRHVSMVNSSLQADTCSTRAKKHIVSNSRTCFYSELQNLQTDTCSNRYWFPSCVENQNEGSSGQYIWNFVKFFDHLSLPLQHRSCLPGETCRPPGLRNSHNAPFHPVTSYSGNKKKNLVSLFLPTVWLHCEILLLVSSIIYVYSLRPCCRRAGLWHVSHFVYDDGFRLRLSRKTSDMNLM